MGEVMSYDLQGCRCASLRVQEFKKLINRKAHHLASLACDRPSLLSYHNLTDSATCEKKEGATQILHLLRHVRGSFEPLPAGEEEISDISHALALVFILDGLMQ